MKFQETIGQLRLEDVEEVTQDVFGTKPTFEEEFDPDNPEDRFLVAVVNWKGAPKEIVERRLEWHDRVSRLAPLRVGLLRLMVIPT